MARTRGKIVRHLAKWGCANAADMRGQINRVSFMGLLENLELLEREGIVKRTDDWVEVYERNYERLGETVKPEVAKDMARYFIPYELN